MCGIAGFQTKLPINKEAVIGEMIHKIKHRGPDGQGTFHTKNITFGHVRLSIVDIKNNQQPMHSHDNKLTIIYNGEIYNYLELRMQLRQKGYEFKTHSDTEVLINMYKCYGKKMLQHIIGMFSFAIYDLDKDYIFIARDHFGIKPLYYHSDNTSFVFASEIKALFKFPNITPEANPDALHEYITFQFVLNKNTLFKNIFKLEPAQYLIIKNSKIVEKKSYWNASYNIDWKKNENEFSEELLILLNNSISIQTRADVPIGSYLSGGIDSSLVSTLAAKNYLGTLKTFCGGFKQIGYNETGYALKVSKKIKSQHFNIFPTSNDFADSFEKLIYLMDEPAAGPGIFPQYMVSKLASKHVKVVMGGQGADEIFGGYSRYTVAYLEQCLKGAIFETQEEGKHVVTLQSMIDNLPLLKTYLPMIKSQFSNGLFADMGARYYQLINRAANCENTYNADFLKQRDEKSIFQKFLQTFNKIDSKSYFNKMTNFDMQTSLPALLQVEDRVSLGVSIESRVPFLDKRIMELVSTMPPAIKYAGGKSKYILLKSIKNILPSEIMNRKDKMGFPVPLNQWFNGPLKGYISDIINSKKFKERGIFNQKEIKKLIQEKNDYSRDIWGVLNLEIWFRTFIDR